MPETEALVVSYSELDALRQCKFKWNLSYRQRWASPKASPALMLGKLWHQVLEWHYNTLKAGDFLEDLATASLLDNVLRTGLLGDGSATPTREQDLAWWMYRGHLERWNRDEEWEIIAIEQKLESPLPAAKRPLIFKGTIDLIVKWGEALWIVDHKSSKDLPRQFELDMADQFGLYVWLAREHGYPVRGAIHSAARTDRLKRSMTLDERFSRRTTFRSDAEIAEIVREVTFTFEDAFDTYEAGRVVRSPDQDRCRWRCSFSDPCQMSRRQGGQAVDKLMPEFGFIVDKTRH